MFKSKKKWRNVSDSAASVTVTQSTESALNHTKSDHIGAHASDTSAIAAPRLTSLDALSFRRKNRTANKLSDPLGLHLLYFPKENPTVDIIFVHGLGGTSRYTWCKDRNLDLFWPLKWLPLEGDIADGRIFTFGYNANFRAPGTSVTNILDFAKGLLWDMRYGTSEDGQEFALGKVSLGLWR